MDLKEKIAGTENASKIAVGMENVSRPKLKLFANVSLASLESPVRQRNVSMIAQMEMEDVLKDNVIALLVSKEEIVV